MAHPPGFLVLLLLLAILAPGLPAQELVRTHEGAAEGDALGWALAPLADLNGDGVPEYAAGRPFATTALGFGTGVVEIRDGASGAILRTLEGNDSDGRFGRVVASGDLNGDGRPELIVAAPSAQGSAGEGGLVFAFDADTGSLLWSREALTGSEGLGSALVVVGDLDGDRLADVAVGAPRAPGPAGALAGRVDLLRGTDGVLIRSLPGGQAGERFGSALAAAGDVDADFLPDLAVGAPLAEVQGVAKVGLVRWYDRHGGLLGQRGGTQSLEAYGASLAGLGDVDGDGAGDLAVGAPGHQAVAGLAAGRVEVLSAAGQGLIWALDGKERGERFGLQVARAGDLDGDGRKDLLAAAPFADGAGFDRGRVLALAGRDGAEHFEHLGTQDSGGTGLGLAGGADGNDDGRRDALIGTPGFTSAGGTGAGHVATVGLRPSIGLLVTTLATPAQPIAAAVADVDGDGDQDLVVLCRTALVVRIFWNGDHAANSGFTSGDMGILPPSDLALPAGAAPSALAVGALDNDAVAEIAVGRDDGTLTLLDGQGSTLAPTFAATLVGFALDPRPSAGPVGGLAILPGATPRLGAALMGTPSQAGRLVLLSDPVSAPVLGAPLIEGGVFSSLRRLDVNADGHDDLLAANSSTGAFGGIHVALGPLFGMQPPVASPLGAPVLDAAAAALESDGTTNDLLFASGGIGGGGSGVVRNWVPGSPGTGTATTQSNAFVRSVAAWSSDGRSRGLATIDGLGTLFLVDDWDGNQFTHGVAWPIGAGATALAVGELEVPAVGAACQGEELVVVLAAESKVRILRQDLGPRDEVVPGTGCPTSTVQFVVTGRPVLGTNSFTIGLTGATPFSQALLALQTPPVPGQVIPVLNFGNCGILGLPVPYLFLPEAPAPPFGVDGAGMLTLPVPLANDPALLCAEFVLQWAVLDGTGPLAGISPSEARVLRIGLP